MTTASDDSIRTERTWADLAPQDLALGELEANVLSEPTLQALEERWCAKEVWERHWRPVAERLAGMGRRIGPPDLQEPTAFDVVVDHLYPLLPACKHDGPCSAT